MHQMLGVGCYRQLMIISEMWCWYEKRTGQLTASQGRRHSWGSPATEELEKHVPVDCCGDLVAGHWGLVESQIVLVDAHRDFLEWIRAIIYLLKKSDKNWLKRTVAKKLERGECFGEKRFCLVDRAESEEYNSIESRLWFYLNSIKVFLHNYPYFWTLMDRYFFVFLKLVRHHNLRLYKKKTAQHKY